MRRNSTSNFVLVLPHPRLARQPLTTTLASRKRHIYHRIGNWQLRRHLSAAAARLLRAKAEQKQTKLHILTASPLGNTNKSERGLEVAGEQGCPIFREQRSLGGPETARSVAGTHVGIVTARPSGPRLRRRRRARGLLS
jgi:hypothetical protein